MEIMRVVYVRLSGFTFSLTKTKKLKCTFVLRYNYYENIQLLFSIDIKKKKIGTCAP